jgi:hypothetical protein
MRIQPYTDLKWGKYNMPILLMEAPKGSFEVITRVAFTPTANLNQVGLMVYQDDYNWTALGWGRYDTGIDGESVPFGIEQLWSRSDVFFADATPIPSTTGAYLRLVYTISETTMETSVRAYWSLDGQNWAYFRQMDGNYAIDQIGLYLVCPFFGNDWVTSDFFLVRPLSTP